MTWLGLGAAGTLAPGCLPWRPAPGRCVALEGGQVIDVHAHFFNASDVPVDGFVRYVALGEIRKEAAFADKSSRRRAFVNAVIAFLVDILSQGAVSAKTELARLKAGTPPESASDIEQAEAAVLTEAVLTVDRRARSRATVSSTDDNGLAPDYGALLSRLASEAGIFRVSAAQPLSREQAAAIANGLRNKPNEFRGYVTFALLLLRSREAVIDEYVRVFAPSNCVSLVTPSFLDMHRWLDTDPPRSRISAQIDVMDALQVKIARKHNGFHMHSFVGFDPWRASEDKTVLPRVQRAITEQGFIGIKLYPPMGFRASGNEAFGQRGKNIEVMLRRLYAWCEKEDVPIMAHAENSLGSNCGYGKRASPQWWLPVLERYPDLRVNLAHFGSFDELLRAGPQPGDRCRDDEFEGPAWEFIIGRAIEAGHDNLFADLGYLSELTSPEDGETVRAAIRGHLAEFRSFDPEARHLLYGTDWTMIAKETDNNNYLSNLSGQLSKAEFTAEQQQNIRWKNAVRFLGLGRNRKSRKRIHDYCVRRQIDAG